MQAAPASSWDASNPSVLELFPTSARTEDGEVVFWVRDDGIGIPPEQVDRIFERFYQVDSSTTRMFRGAGLGLSMVRDLLVRMGGTIDVRSAPHEGSTFTVRLPVAATVA